MHSRPIVQADAERAVSAFKHALMTKVMRYIVEKALLQPTVYPGDVPVDIVDAEHRQGVVSNAWGSLRALGIIAPLPVRYFNDEQGIIAGKKINPHDGAKGRMVMVYSIASRQLALTWMERNGGRGSIQYSVFSVQTQTDLDL